MTEETFSAFRPLLSVSMGDPVGIGPEVVVKALSVPEIRDDADFVVYGDPAVLARAIELTHVGATVEVIEQPLAARRFSNARAIPCVPISQLPSENFGWAQPTPDADRAQIEYVERSVRAIFDGSVDGVVTAPINKASIARAGSTYPGHTEMLADLCGR